MSPDDAATISAIAELQRIDLLDCGSQLVLQAVSQKGESAMHAFKAWRALSSLDDADYKHHRAMPLLAAIAEQEQIDDPDIVRMRGVGRHLWTTNALKVNLLFRALDALNSRGIVPLLLTRAALFARAPDMIRQHALGELEILIEPQQLKVAGEALAAHGFLSLAPAAVVFDRILIGGETAGISLTLADHVGGITIRSQPLPGFSSDLLSQALWQNSVQLTLQSRNVRIPTAAHHLLCTIARCEPWDQIECFARLLEATFLLSVANEELDWAVLAQLTRQLGLEESARTFLAVLARDTGHSIPDAVFEETAKARTAVGREEWRIRTRPPKARERHELLLLMAQDRHNNRDGKWMAPELNIETILRLLPLQKFAMYGLWALTERRILPNFPNFPRYMGGSISSNPVGRKKKTQWAILTLPLTAAQKTGQAVSFEIAPFLANTVAYIAASGGSRTVNCKVASGYSNNMEIVVRPVEKLGGNGLVLMRVEEGI